jgi:hypothetical protein
MGGRFCSKILFAPTTKNPRPAAVVPAVKMTVARSEILFITTPTVPFRLSPSSLIRFFACPQNPPRRPNKTANAFATQGAPR